MVAELLLGNPIFPGASAVDQLVEIIKVLGSPTKDELMAMNPNYKEFKFPQIRPQPFERIFTTQTSREAIDVASQMLYYVPTRRCKAIEVCGHPFFDTVREPATRLPDGSPVPLELFRLTEEELALAPEMAAKLVPPHVVASIAGTAP